MLRKTKDLKGLRLAAHDGEIGRLKDFYFDDQHWAVRYLVVDSGTWLPERKVLLSPFAVADIRAESDKAIGVNLTRNQIEQSPPIETHMPVSRQFETQYYQYYGWPYYWPGPLLWGPVEAPGPYVPTGLPQDFPAQIPASCEDSHLRSVDEMAGFYGYQLQALDEAFGHVEQFIIDDKNWAIRYLVADTRTWLPGKRVLLSPQWIAWVSWSEARVYLDFDRETIRRAPEYDPSAELTPEYEKKLFEHYYRQPQSQNRKMAA